MSYAGVCALSQGRNSILLHGGSHFVPKMAYSAHRDFICTVAERSRRQGHSHTGRDVPVVLETKGVRDISSVAKGVLCGKKFETHCSL